LSRSSMSAFARTTIAATVPWVTGSFIWLSSCCPVHRDSCEEIMLMSVHLLVWEMSSEL
jgi:hypothetical protein